MTHIASIVAILFYVASSALMLVQLWRSRVGGRVSRITRGLFLIALIAHCLTVASILFGSHKVLLDNGADYFLWVSLGLALVYAFLQRRLDYPIVGAFIVPAIVLFMGCSSYLLHQEATSLISSASTSRIGVFVPMLHAVPAFVAVVSLVLSLIVSVVFLIVERRLKQRTGGALSISGPNLQLLDRLNRGLVQVGFLAITLVVLSGGLWAVSEHKPVFVADTSVVSGIVLWALLALILHARLVLEWSPKRVSRLTVLVTASYFVTVFIVLILAGRLNHAELL